MLRGGIRRHFDTTLESIFIESLDPRADDIIREEIERSQVLRAAESSELSVWCTLVCLADTLPWIFFEVANRYVELDRPLRDRQEMPQSQKKSLRNTRKLGLAAINQVSLVESKD